MGIEALHLAGASLNSVDNDGDTAAIQAVYNNNPEALDYLLKCNADVHIRNKDKKTALDYSRLKSFNVCENIILSHLQRVACSSQEAPLALGRCQLVATSGAEGNKTIWKGPDHLTQNQI